MKRKAGHGGADRGQGRTSNAAQAIAAARADISSGRARSVTSMFGHGDDSVIMNNKRARRPSAFIADVVKWQAHNDDGNDSDQRQVKGGLVRYNIYPDKEYILVQEGSTEGTELYWVDADGQEVPPQTSNAVPRSRGDKGQLKLRERGLESCIWVTKGHVSALSFGKAPQTVSEILGPRRQAEVLDSRTSGSSDPDDTENEGEHPNEDSAQENEDGENNDEEQDRQQHAGQQGRPEVGEGRKRALNSIRRQRKARRECKAKGHSFQPKWLEKYDWLRTEPHRTAREWELQPQEAPAYMFCVCCVAAAPSGGQKDVLTRKVSGSLRGDKLKAHWHNKPAHARAYMKWKAKQAPSSMHASAIDSSSTYSMKELDNADTALAALVRTIMVTAASKSALTMVRTLTKLQLANGCVITEAYNNATETGGVQQLLHAAATILRRKQDERLRSGKIFSIMGDGSTDRKTVEQQV